MSDCARAYARIESGHLIVGNAVFERRWRLGEGRLCAVELLHKETGRQWLRGEAPAAPELAGELRLESWRMRTSVSDEFLRAHLIASNVTWQFDLFDDLPAITLTRLAPAAKARPDDASSANVTGVEQDPTPASGQISTTDLVEALPLQLLHCDLIAVEIREQTDVHENLVFERTWMLHPAERSAEAKGNVFAIEERASGDGLILLKHAPAPYARMGAGDGPDVAVSERAMVIRGHGRADGAGYPHTLICYRGGKPGRIAALHRFQHHLRPYRPQRDGLLVSNTWGDRNRDAAIGEAFLLAEADAGSRLGVDVLQIDDGWQKGRSANSVNAGGVWTGFWASDEHFWDAHPERLPRGLDPVVQKLNAGGMSLGLWFAPDSSNHCASWERDADQVLDLWRRNGVCHVKIDAVKMSSPEAEANVARFYDKVLRESEGAVCFDSDVTAGVRPGFWGNMHAGAIFVENRYTDWHRYWPHHTLRNLWMLSHYIPPVRLRMEFLNATRNRDKYTDDPLAPANYAPDTLFATVMFSSPLAWFEVSRLPEEYHQAIAPLVQIWKQHRAAIHTSVIRPIGAEPDGFSWTGLMTEGPGRRYAVVFNELSREPSFALPAPMIRDAHVLHGAGHVDVQAGLCEVHLAKPLSHVFLAFEAG